MSALAIVLGSLIIWLAVSPVAAVLIGRACKLRDTHETPGTAVSAGKATTRRPGAHLRSVR